MDEMNLEINASPAHSSVGFTSSVTKKPWVKWLLFVSVVVLSFAAGVGAWILVE